VLADETRPFLQGARLTAWELMQDRIETVLIADSAAGSLLRSGAVDLVVVGADRIARNGDVANKIGTYSAAVLAKENGVPFYVAAPVSTIDPACPDGDARSFGGYRARRRAGRPRGRRGLESGVRRDAGALRHRHHHGARRRTPSLCGLLGRPDALSDGAHSRDRELVR
jgi:hypothetical protein